LGTETKDNKVLLYIHIAPTEDQLSRRRDSGSFEIELSNYGFNLDYNEQDNNMNEFYLVNVIYQKIQID
jgi:hypothetical protein